MLKATAEFMLLVIMLDLIISAAWVGMLLIKETRQIYSEVFPKGVKLPQINIRRKIKSSERRDGMCQANRPKSIIEQLREVYEGDRETDNSND